MFSKYSVRRPFTIFVAVVIVLIFGGVSFYKMTPDLFPQINTPYAMVATVYPGASAEEAEKQLTEPMENQLATLNNIKNVTSVSADNYSLVSLEFNDDVNMDAVSVDIREKIDQIKGSFPERAETPLVMKINLDMMPVVVSAVSMKDSSSESVSEFTRENLENQLKGVEGVASVSSMGMVDDGIQIVLSQKKIDKVNDDISDAIRRQFAEGENKISSGISSAKKGQKKIKSGKEKLSDAGASYEKLRQSRQELLDKKVEIEGLPDNTPAEIQQKQQMLNVINGQIQAVDDAMQAFENKGMNSFTLSSSYSDLAASESTLQSVVSQLQSSLSEVESSRKAALDSADMTGVLTMDNIAAILNAQNFSMPAGYVSDGDARLLVNVGDKIKDEKELRNLILFDMGIDGVDPIRLYDVGSVTYLASDSDTYARINGENGVLLTFTKQSSYSTATVAKNINDKFASLEKEHKGLKFTNLMDQGEYIHIVINSVLRNLLLGAVLAVLILLFFLRDIRPTLITAVSIPVSVIFAVALMYFSGVTLNMISLSGLAIGVGMLVDNSIVVVENTYRLRALGYTAVQAAVSGASQVAGAITASTLTTVCVFVPIVFVDGMTRDIFTDLALTVTYSLIASLIIALTMVPALSRGMLRQSTKKTVLGQKGRVVKKYRQLVESGLNHGRILLAGALVLLIASGAILLVKGMEFMPAMSSPQISVSIQMPEGSSLRDTARANDEISGEIRKIDGVQTVGAMLSSDTLGMMGMSAVETDVTQTTMYIVLEDNKAEQGRVIASKMKEFEKKYNAEIITSADMDMTTMMGGSDISLNLYSDDLDKLRTAGEKTEKALTEMKSLSEVSDISELSTDELHVTVNKNDAMKKGLTVAQIYQQIAAKLSTDKEATRLIDSGESIDVSIANSTKGTFSRKDLEKMTLTAENKDGSREKVALKDVASIGTGYSLTQISHDSQKRTYQVTASVNDGYNITKVSSDLRRKLSAENIIPAGVTVDYGGQNEEIMKSMGQMLLMLIIGLILVYLVMVAQFQSLRSPFIIFFTIPLAFTGGMAALIISNNVLSIVSMMGFVMLMGIVVNNGIVLVDCINRFRLEGMDKREAIIQAGSVRMRPVIMTATTTVLGLLPLALGFGTGAEMVQPVAIVCIGGLIYATVTTLFIVPVMYNVLSKRRMSKIEDEELEIVTG